MVCNVGQPGNAVGLEWR